ncbi:MAG: hypothetical protein AAFR87_18170 [Bacteroidota bacterium]
MHNLFLFICLLIFYSSVSAQYEFRFQQEYFFGNLPTAKTEAMGRADVAIGGTMPSIFFNPAGLTRIQGQEISFSTSAPFYALTQSDYYFFGYGREILPGIYAGLSLNQLAIGPTSFSTEINGTRYPLDNPKSSNFALTLAGEVIENLNVGVNVNLFELKLFDDAQNGKTLHFDAGATYQLPLAENKNLRFGASFNNFTYSSISFESPTGSEASNNFPAVARVGLAYESLTNIDIPGDKSVELGLTLTAEHMNVLNSDYRTSFQVGAEGVINQVLVLRLGYFTHNLNDYGVANNKDRLSDLTYGFGFIIPFDKISDGKFPFQGHLDYVSLKAPPYVVSGRRNANMRSFTFRIVIPISNSSK